ncbi:MAG: DUF4199 domain-containing protein, partial [Flavobacteriales bacterium]
SFTGVYIFLKILTFLFEVHSELFKYLVFANLLLLLLSIFFTVQKKYKERGKQGGLFSDIKAGLRAVSVYALAVSVFVYIYYGFIDRDYMENKIKERVEWVKNADIEKLKKENDNLNYANKKDLIREEKERAEFLFTAFTQSTFTLLALILTGLVYSGFIALLYRKVLWSE